jgi:hypothetical protein
MELRELPGELYDYEYTVTKNPLWIWRAIQQSLSNNRALPQFCIEYLLRASQGILNAKDAAADLDTGLKQALEIVGHHYASLDQEQREINIYLSVREIMWNHPPRGISIDEACLLLSKEKGMPADQRIRQIYYNLRRRLKKLADEQTQEDRETMGYDIGWLLD